MNSLVGQYVNKLTINNINDFALKNNIKLNKKELNVLLEVAKKHYSELLEDNSKDVEDYLKDHLTNENYDKVVGLYYEYKEKYQGYLK